MSKDFDRQAPVAFQALPAYLAAVKFGNSHVHLIGSTNYSGKTLCGKQPKMALSYVNTRANCKDCCARFRDGQRI
jgi:hypothetical protein